ncbi:MAG: pyridoxal phosphate-dependent aminotransferase, partial [Gemmiger sp.]|nr:pyridoxal phosphate-dependent aminotransferase [Gemmiger sp.]
MQYDFTTLRDRSGQGSQKWRSMLALDPQVPQGVAPMSVADMEFVPQPELVRAMQQYAAEMVYGYTEATDAYYAAVIDWMHRRHGYRVQKEWIVEAPGV